MRRTLGILVLMTVLASRTASSIQLHWSDGTDALTFAAAARCTLVVQADSTESRLPSEWRVLWVADSCDISPVALGETIACAAPEAQVSAVDEPSTSEDSTEHLRTVHFCSEGNDPTATLARYLLDLPAGSAGKFKVVALDPNDSTQVIQSNEVTFNGGAAGEYAMVILRTSSSRVAEELTVSAAGVGLTAARTVTIGNPVQGWRIGLSIVAQSDSLLTAQTYLPANVPNGILEATTADGAQAAARFAANSSYGQSSTLWYPSVMAETLGVAAAIAAGVQWTAMQPKDFAFIHALSKFHLFYIRRRMTPGTDVTEKNFGHAWSTNLTEWHYAQLPRDTSLLDVSGGTWDNFHVWAPHIVAKDGSFWMFYAGVQLGQGNKEIQQIGVATSPDLDTWQRQSTILSVFDIPWAKRVSPQDGSQQLRDPFVMEDPTRQGWWLMYFSAIDSTTSAMAIGVAHSNGNFLQWSADAHPIRSTDSTSTHGACRAESPHIVEHSNRYWLFFSPGSLHCETDTTLLYSPVSFVMGDSAGSPIDTLAAHWSAPDTLYYYPNRGTPDPNLQYWHGSEHLIVGDHEYLAAYDDQLVGIAIGEMNWYGPHDFIVGSSSSANLGVDPSTTLRGLALTGLGPVPAQGGVVMKLTVPCDMWVGLDVFDAAGRRVRHVFARRFPAGSSFVSWDGLDESAVRVPSGIYFVRMSCRAGARLAKAVIVR